MKVYIDPVGYDSKPTGKEVGKVTLRVVENLVNIDIPTLAEEIAVNGKTCLACQLQYPRVRKSTPIVVQETLMLDFDNKEGKRYTINDLQKDPFMLKYAAFWYRTFNDDGDGNDRFRVVFKLDQPLMRNKDVEDMYHFLLHKYPQADKSCNSPNRLFFGSKKGYTEINFNNTLKVRDLELYTFLVLHPVYGNRNIKSVDDIVFTHETPNWELLKAGQYHILKEKLNSKYRKEYSSLANARKVMKLSIDMVEFLELPDSKTFRDILHVDSNPSATVFKSDTGAWLYHCHSHSHKFTGDLIYLVSKLTRTSISEATSLMVDLTGGAIDSDSEISRIKRNIELFSSILLDDDTKKQHPAIYKFFGSNTPEIVAILNVMIENAYEDFETGEVRILNFLGLEKLAYEASKILGHSVSKPKVARVINQLAFVDVLTKLPQEDIPKAVDELISRSQKRTKHKNKTTVYDLTEFEHDQFEHISDMSESILNNGYTASAFTYEFILRMFGEADAHRVFPQNNRREVSEESYNVEDIAVTFIFDEIMRNKYVTENDVKKHLATYKGLGVKLSDYKWKQIRTDLIMKYNLKRGRLSIKLKEQLGIQTDNNLSNPVVIYEEPAVKPSIF